MPMVRGFALLELLVVVIVVLLAVLLLPAALGTSKVILAWDHDFTPGCSDHDAGPVTPLTSDVVLQPDPVARHQGAFDVLFCDGHARPVLQEDLQGGWFYIQANGADRAVAAAEDFLVRRFSKKSLRPRHDRLT